MRLYVNVCLLIVPIITADLPQSTTNLLIKVEHFTYFALHPMTSKSITYILVIYYIYLFFIW